MTVLSFLLNQQFPCGERETGAFRAFLSLKLLGQVFTWTASRREFAVRRVGGAGDHHEAGSLGSIRWF